MRKALSTPPLEKAGIVTSQLESALSHLKQKQSAPLSLNFGLLGQGLLFSPSYKTTYIQWTTSSKLVLRLSSINNTNPSSYFLQNQSNTKNKKIARSVPHLGCGFHKLIDIASTSKTSFLHPQRVSKHTNNYQS